jgi:predicted Zn-dependent peptidase
VYGKKVSLHYTPARIPVVIEERPYARTVALSIYITVGSRDEPRGREGIAHLLEHVIFKGTKNMTSKETSELIEAAGGELNGYTGKEMTCYYTVTLSETVETAQRILADTVLNPLLEKDAIEIEKDVVADEIRMLQDEPDDYIHYLLTRAIWDGHPMAFSEAGEIDGVNLISDRELREFYERFYRPSNFVITACGRVNSQKILEWAAESFDEGATKTTTKNRIPPTPRSCVELFPRKGEQTYVGIGFPGYFAGHPDRFAQTLLSAILGGGTSSRLYQNIREKRGLVYSIYTTSQPYSDCGLFGIFFSAKSSRTETVCRAVGEEIGKLKNDGLEGDELTRAKRFIKGMLVRKLESTESRMFHLGEFFVLTGKIPTEAEILSNLERITEEDIARAAEKLLDRNKTCVAIYGSPDGNNSTREGIDCLDF